MRLAVVVAATLCLGLGAAADGVSRRAVTSPGFDPLSATGSSMMTGDVPVGHEVRSYRHGATYKVDAGTTALACEAACGEDMVCQAWSFVDAYGGAEARCELKRGGGRPEENLLATSGVSPRIDGSYWGAAPTEDAVPEDVLIGEGPTPAGAAIAGDDPIISYSYTLIAAN
jgi:PAN domain